MNTEIIRFRWLGLQDYQTSWQSMKAFTDGRDAQTIDEIWMLEHPPIFTQGQNGNKDHILDAGNIPIIQSDRGGQVTYHGPGQLMIYTLIDLKRKKMTIREIVRRLEQSIIDYLAALNIVAESNCDAPGVYVDQKKIASIGLRVRRFCVYHGIAFNLNMDLSPFTRINPCGFSNLEMTQLADLSNKPTSAKEVVQNLGNFLIRNLVYTQHTWSNDNLLYRD